MSIRHVGGYTNKSKWLLLALAFDYLTITLVLSDLQRQRPMAASNQRQPDGEKKMKPGHMKYTREKWGNITNASQLQIVAFK